MASNQPVPNAVATPAAVMPAPTALKDSPAVERALNRSKLYLLISWSLLYPEDEEFLDYLRSGEFVEDGRAALDTLKAMLDGQGGGHAAQRLEALRKQMDLAEALVASECSNWQLSDLQSEHRRVFSNVITLDCPPYETLFAGSDLPVTTASATASWPTGTPKRDEAMSSSTRRASAATRRIGQPSVWIASDPSEPPWSTVT